MSSDAVAACSAELIYGQGSGASDFAYVFIDGSVSGGLVQNGHVRFARDDLGSNMGKVLVPNHRAEMVPLHTLAGAVRDNPDDPRTLELLARGIAYAVYSASSIVNYDAVIVDGSIPPASLRQLVMLLRRVLAELSGNGAATLSVSEGSRVRKPATLGPACLPLADRFYPAVA